MLQEAEMRIIREGEEIFNLSQGEEVAFLADPRTSALNILTNPNSNSNKDRKNTGTTGLRPGITSTEG